MSLKIILFAVVLLAIPTFAAPIVTYTTTGTITCAGCGGSGTSAVTFGTGTLVYLAGGGMVDLGVINPSNGNFGEIDASGFATTEGINGTLTLTINQTTPTGGTGDLIATLSGNIEAAASSGRLHFTTSSVVIAGNVTYTVSQPSTGILIVPPSTNGGITTIQGTIEIPTAVPEPGTWTLVGAALIGVGATIRRRIS